MKDYKNLQNGSDIRGVALEGVEGEHVNLSKEAVADLAAAFAVWLAKKMDKNVSDLSIAVGTDSRISAKELLDASCKALSAFGVKILNCGLASTPAMYMATQFKETDCDGAIMLTASHLPYNRNGMKFFTKKSGLEKADIAELISIAETIEIKEKQDGEILDYYIIDLYSKHLRGMIQNAVGDLKGLHIVVDAGNGASGFFATDVLSPLGADISGSQFLEPNGYFPNHEPNPENKTAMESISKAVINAKADLGIIFDTDGDRSAAVDRNGKEIARNGIVALAAALVSEKYPGTTVVTDSITSNELHDFLENKLGMKHFRFKRGYRNVINKGMEIDDCHLAIETSGHAAIKENYWLDDGAYLATQIVIKAKQLPIDELLKDLTEALEAKEIRIKVKADNFADYAQNVIDNFKLKEDWTFEEPNYEGIRVNTPEGWFLLRKSLHDPLLPLNIESNVKGGLAKMEQEIKEILKEYDKLEI